MGKIVCSGEYPFITLFLVLCPALTLMAYSVVTDIFLQSLHYRKNQPESRCDCQLSSP